ncbi:MAG: hypothetical protein AAGG47_11160 [Pseudomonadota bacterium]
MFRQAGRVRPFFAGTALLVVGVVAPFDAWAQDTDTQGVASIPYSAILQDPDNLELTVAYARQELATGNLPGASAALERLIILYPDENTVRLLYAVTLFRLDQVAEAQREFEAVNPEALSSADRRVLAEYQEQAVRRLSTVTGNVGFTLGVQYDTNRDNFPLGGTFQVDIPGLGPSVIDTDEEGEDDVGIFGVVAGRIDYKLPSQTVQRVSFDFTALGVEQFELDEFDVVSGFASVSAFIDATVLDIEPRATFRQIYLGGERYLRSGEGGVRLQRAIGNDQRLLGFVDISGGFDDFASVDADEFADEKTGPFVQARTGVLWTPTDRLGIVGSYTFSERFADEDFEAFSQHGVSVTAQYVVNDAAALRLSADYAFADFDGPDPFISTTTTQEDHAVGARLGLLLRADGLLRAAGADEPIAALDDLSLNLGFGYRRVFSNLDNFDYQNFRFEASITKQFFF